MNIAQASLEKLDFNAVREALALRAATLAGKELALALMPDLDAFAILKNYQRITEAITASLSVGGVSNIRPLIDKVFDGMALDGEEILQIAHTMDAAGSIKRAILDSERPALAELARRLSSFDSSLRLVREQLDIDGRVRDDATPKLRDIRKRLNPLRGRINNKLQELLQKYSSQVQDPIVTIRRERYVIPVIASFQAKVPGIALDISDSGATVFIEPQAVVSMNNELAVLEFEERDEVRRILVSLAQKLAYEEGLQQTLEVLAKLDLISASARLAQEWQLSKVEINKNGEYYLPEARHPLIENAIANTIVLDNENRLLAITGPNAGGKTVMLKTLGLAVLMMHSGLFVASRAEPGTKQPQLPFIKSLLTDIGDEQSIEASLSTYAGHLRNLKNIVDNANQDSLVLIDELGSGTDPAEGAALSQAVLEQVLISGSKGLITTHLGPLKVFASETKGILNAAMRFDLEKLIPTYKLDLGLPGRSYALSIAERMGLPSKILTRASEILGPEGERLESLLETLEKQRLDLEEKILEAEIAQEKAINEAGILQKQIAMLRDKEADVIAAAALKADDLLKDTLQRAKTLKKTASSDKKQRSQALQELQELRKTVKKKAQPKIKKITTPTSNEIAVGSVVEVEEYNAQGTVVEIRKNEYVVQLGLIKVEVAKADAKLVKSKKKKKRQSAYAAPSSFDSELNMRGDRVEAGLEKLRDFILEARSLNVKSVRILHGKGTGVLRDAVRNYLKNEKYVERYEDAIPYEGGHGVTVAYLRK